MATFKTSYSVYNKSTDKKIKSVTRTYEATDKARAEYLSQLFKYIDLDKSKVYVEIDSIKKA